MVERTYYNNVIRMNYLIIFYMLKLYKLLYSLITTTNQ